MIVDTNILFSALYDPNSYAGKLVLYAIERRVSLFAPESVRRELERNLVKKLEYAEKEAREIIAALPVEWVAEKIYAPAFEIARRHLTHEADVPILASSLVTGYEIVSGDKHLLSIERGIAKVWELAPLMKRIHRDPKKDTSPMW